MLFMKLKENSQIPETEILLVISVAEQPLLCQFQDTGPSVHTVVIKQLGDQSWLEIETFLKLQKAMSFKGDAEIQGCPHTTSKTNKIQQHDVLSMACPEQHRKPRCLTLSVTKASKYLQLCLIYSEVQTAILSHSLFPPLPQSFSSFSLTCTYSFIFSNFLHCLLTHSSQAFSLFVSPGPTSSPLFSYQCFQFSSPIVFYNK